MASLNIPPRLFWFPLWGTSRCYLLPNRVCFSEVTRRGRLKTKKPKKTKNKTSSINNFKNPCSSLNTKSLNFEQRAGWDGKSMLTHPLSSCELGGLRAAAKVICLYIFGQEMQFNPLNDWSLCKINGIISNIGLYSDSTKSESSVSLLPSPLTKQGQLILHFKSSKLFSRKFVPGCFFAGRNSFFWGENQRWHWKVWGLF